MKYFYYSVRAFFTSVILFLYGIIWIILESIIYKEIQPRIVDDIMTLLFAPLVWLAVDNILRRIKEK